MAECGQSWRIVAKVEDSLCPWLWRTSASQSIWCSTCSLFFVYKSQQLMVSKCFIFSRVSVSGCMNLNLLCAGVRMFGFRESRLEKFQFFHIRSFCARARKRCLISKYFACKSCVLYAWRASVQKIHFSMFQYLCAKWQFFVGVRFLGDCCVRVWSLRCFRWSHTHTKKN
jgi:hypothetical protein